MATLGKNVEVLKNMNEGTAKYAKWYVRIISPQIVPYCFFAKGEQVHAKKFQCVLVSADPSQYMFGLVPFDFKNREAAQQAYSKFTDLSVWEITTPAFDTKSKPEFNGCPLKSVVLLTKPTTAKRVPPTNQAMLQHPATGLQVHLDITGIMNVLTKRSFRESSGTAKLPTKAFDFFGKFRGLSQPKKIDNIEKYRRVSEAEFVDGSGGLIKVSVWDDAYQLVEKLKEGDGVAVIGCTATKDNAEVKLNIWPGAHTSTDGQQAQSLTSLDTSSIDMQLLTAPKPTS
jgi:hypothetical protein